MNNVVVLDNPSPFYNPFQFEITFECIEDLSEGESDSRPPPGCQLRAADVESFPGPASRGRPVLGARRAAGSGLGSAEGNLKLMDYGCRGARGVRPQPGRLPRLNLLGTYWSGGSHVVSFVWRAGDSRDPHSRRLRGLGVGPGSANGLHGFRGPDGKAGKGEACVWSRRRVSSGAILSRAENWATDPGVTTPPLRG